MPMTLNEAIKIMTDKIVSVLAGNKPAIYLFGSVALDDFKLGWSDIDIAVLTKHEITEQQADTLVGLRQTMYYPGNPYFRLFEGGMLSADAFLNDGNERTVYWGTSGQRITDNWKMDSFGMAELLDGGILLYGKDIRAKMIYPIYAQMRNDISHHVQMVRKYGDSVDWLLDIARGIYTLRTGKVIAKTAAGEWALENGLCPDEDAMQKAIAIRKEPQNYSREDKIIDCRIVGRFIDVIDNEFAETLPIFAESELQHMDIAHLALSLLQNKDGVSVWRVEADNGYVMKCFEKAEHRREITNYQVLTALGIPTLKVIAHTNYSIVLEDIEQSKYRLGVADDMNSPQVMALVGAWYKTLHENGRVYVNKHSLYDECDCITLENISKIKEQTGTGGLQVWAVIEENFDALKSAAMKLPRTLTYNDFYYTNLAVAKDNSSALVFDYNLLGKGYVYSDIRNVCSSLGEEAKAAFLSAYGGYNVHEKAVDDVVSPLVTLHFACQRENFPSWAAHELEKVKDGQLMAAVTKLLNGGKYMREANMESYTDINAREIDSWVEDGWEWSVWTRLMTA
jgi:predicted nucleotidyltransferase